MEDAGCSTGIERLDGLLGGLHVGDNLFWETDAGAYVDLFVEKFARLLKRFLFLFFLDG